MLLLLGRRGLAATILLLLACFSGCNHVENVLDEQLILGTWCNDEGKEVLSFYSDGTCRLAGLVTTHEGKYALIDAARIRITVPGMLWGESQSSFDYKLQGDTLHIRLTFLGYDGVLTLRRRKS